jgi:vesicle-associated membrane protein 4
LGNAAQYFKKDAKKVERRMWWKDMKLRLIIAFIVLVIIAGIIIGVVQSTKSES